MGQIYITQSRHDFDGVVAPSQNWVYATQSTWWGGTTTDYLHYTYNTPVGAIPANQCGRVVFSDFHVNNNTSTTNVSFPNECDTTPMNAQEKILEFMMFDLASCIVPTGVMPCAAGTTQCGATLCCAAGQVCDTSTATPQCFIPYPLTGTYAGTVDATSSCTAGNLAQWGSLTFVATTPPGTSISMAFQTATTTAGIAAATSIPLGTVPGTSSPIDIGAALAAAGVSRNLPVGRVTFTLTSDTTRMFTPTLDGYYLNFDCVPGT
jgi:hypothetical protein